MKLTAYQRGFIPYALAAFLIGIVGGFSTVLGPAFVHELGIAYQNTTWTALAQAMATAAFAPILGKFGDIVGRRNALLLGIAVFKLGNILSAIANSLAFMLIARFVVGIGSAALAPVILAYIVTEFPKDRVANGFTAYMLISSASVIFGPALGGLITENYSWRMMLWICVGICAVVFMISWISTFGQKSKRAKLQNFDGSGAVFVLIFFSLLLCIPSFGQNFGWTSKRFLAVFAAAVAGLIGLLLVERNKKNPILPGSFIKRRTFFLCIAALFLTQGLMQANMTNTIVFLKYTQPENSEISGYAISVMYLGMSLGALLLGPLAGRIAPKRVLFLSLLLTFVGCALQLLFSAGTSVLFFLLALGLLGFGLGANGTIFMKIILHGLTPEDAGVGTGTYGLFRDLAAPFGVAVFVPYFTNRITALISKGIGAADAAVRSVHSLAVVELVCVFLSILVVLCLPKLSGEGNARKTSL